MMMKKSGFRNDPLLFILAGIELLFILLLLVRSFRTPFVTELNADAFLDNCRDRENVSVRDERVVFETRDPVDGSQLSDAEYKKISAQNKEKAVSYKYPLRSGGYEIAVLYDSEGGHLDDGIYSQYTTGKLSFISERKQSLLLTQDMVFDDAHDVIKGRIYIPFGSSVTDVQAVLSYEGVGKLEIKNIMLRESVAFRFMQILGFLMLFLVIDLLYLILFSKHKKGRAMAAYLLDHKEIPILILIIIMASVPLFARFLYYGHDLKFHMGRLASLAEGLRDMTFPVRIESAMLNGYGYATPLFYCDIFLYPFALLYLLMVPLRLCYISYVICINALTAYFCWKLFSQMSGDTKTALCATAFYCLNIYRLTDIYARAALGEYTALMFIPLAALGLYRIIKKEVILYTDWLPLAAGMAGIALSHLLSLEMMSITLFIYCLIFIRKDIKGKILAIIKAGVTAVLISLWFLVPLAISMSTIEALAFMNIAPIQSTGGYLVQLFALFVSGYGLSNPGTKDQMSVELGGGFLVIFFAGIIFLIRRFSLKEDEDVKKEFHIMNADFIIGCTAVLFSSVYFPWDALAGIFKDRLEAVSDLMQAIQFPWRYLTVAGISLSVSFVYMVIILKKKSTKLYMALLCLMAAMTFVSLCSFYFDFTQKNREETWLFADNDTMMGTAAEEYMLKEHGSEYILKHPDPGIAEGDGKILGFQKYMGRYYLDVKDMAEGSKLRLPILDYGIYTAADTGTGRIFELSQGEEKDLLLSLPEAYSGRICIYYKEPLLYRLCELISVLTLCMLIFSGLFMKRKQNVTKELTAEKSS